MLHFHNFYQKLFNRGLVTFKHNSSWLVKPVLKICIKKNSESLIGDDTREDYDYLCNMFLYSEEALTSFKFKDFDESLGSTDIDTVAKDILPVDFGKLVPLKTLADGNCLYNAVSMFFSGNAGLALELRIRAVNELHRNILEYDIPVCSNYADAKYGDFEEDVVNSVKVGTFSGLRRVAALSNAALSGKIQRFSEKGTPA